MGNAQVAEIAVATGSEDELQAHAQLGWEIVLLKVANLPERSFREDQD